MESLLLIGHLAAIVFVVWIFSKLLERYTPYEGVTFIGIVLTAIIDMAIKVTIGSVVLLLAGLVGSLIFVRPVQQLNKKGGGAK